MERTTLVDALVILFEPVTADLFGYLQLNAKLLADEVNSFQDGDPGIALAAAWAANLSLSRQNAGGHLVTPTPSLGGQRAGTGQD